MHQKTVESCATCMARWVTTMSATHDARVGLRQLPVAGAGASTGALELEQERVDAIDGLKELLCVLRLSLPIARAVLGDLEAWMRGKTCMRLV